METIYMLERNAEAHDDTVEHLGVGYWNEERADTEAAVKRCDVVGYDVDFESNRIRARHSDEAQRQRRKRDGHRLLERITELHGEALECAAAGEPSDAVQEQARQLVADIAIRSEWHTLQPWEDPHEGQLPGEDYRLRLRCEETLIEIIGPISPNEDDLEISVAAPDGTGRETLPAPDTWIEGARWLAAKMGAD